MATNNWLSSQMMGMMGLPENNLSPDMKTNVNKNKNAWKNFNTMPTGTVGATGNTDNNFYGGYADYIGKELKNTIDAGGMSKFLETMLLSGKKQIGRQAGSARDAVAEAQSASGIKGSGANLYNDILETEVAGTEQLTAQVGGLAESAKSQALGQLLGLTQFQGSQDLSKANREEQIRQYEKTFQENVRQFGLNYALKQRELDLAEDAQGGGFWDTLGSIAGGITGIATGGIASGFGTFLGNELFG